MADKRFSASLVWFRRDLRDYDQAALYHALKQSQRVYCVFVFDRNILNALPSRCDRRVEFIHGALAELDRSLRLHGGALIVRHGFPREEIPRLALNLKAEAVFWNRDYEPQAIARDDVITTRLSAQGIAAFEFKDQVIFDRNEIMTQAGKPFTVFTPYKNAWYKKLTAFYLRPYPTDKYRDALAVPANGVEEMPSLAQLGFQPSNLRQLGILPGMAGARGAFRDFAQRIDKYAEARDYPAVKGPSYLSTHLRFGTISIRELAGYAWHLGWAGAQAWLSELIWRDFYQAILYHFPHVVERSFKPEFDAVTWVDDPAGFAAWCEGRTGFPLVDAGMRQLLGTGYMHNRLRMVTASFLSKDLGIDWRLGQQHFAAHLNDFDLAANNGGWQWAASTGCDALPYFRIFNPITQSEKFDPDGKFIRRYVPELARLDKRAIHAPWKATQDELQAAALTLGGNYPLPMVEHDAARHRALERFGKVTGAGSDDFELV